MCKFFGEKVWFFGYILVISIARLFGFDLSVFSFFLVFL